MMKGILDYQVQGLNKYKLFRYLIQKKTRL